MVLLTTYNVGFVCQRNKKITRFIFFLKNHLFLSGGLAPRLCNFFMLISLEHEICNLHKYKLMRHILLPRTAENIIFVLVINFKMPTIVNVNRTDFMLMRVEHKKGFITLVPDFISKTTGANPVFSVYHKVICL